MATQQDGQTVGRHLTSAETVELARIQRDPSVIGYAVLDLDGNQIEASGAWASQIAPVFANVFDLADRMGDHFGEEERSPVLFFESPDFEVAGLLLTSARAVIIKRKPRRVAEGLRSVS
ncbi:MAG: roadblock/LC7 domain-containing protein [Pseudomonadota bacterium]